MKVTKKIISKEVSKNLNISNNISSGVLNFFLETIQKTLEIHDVKISNFGTFYNQKTSKRFGRNPKTKESYIIRPRIKVNFRASKKVKEVFN
jgi:integration host factor subunit alpha